MPTAAVETLPAWAQWTIGGGAAAVVGWSLYVVMRASSWSIGTYRDAGKHDAAQIVELRDEVQKLRDEVQKLRSDYADQRKLKHDWRSFAAAFYSEVALIRQFALAHECGEIVTLVDRLANAREGNPLMADIRSLTGEDYA